MDPLVILLFIVLFILSWFFSGTEIALMSMPSHKVESLLKQNKFGSKSLKYIKSHNDKLLITILIGNNLVNVYTAALATQIAIWIAVASGIEQSLAIWISTWVITFLLLLFGEIIPKSFATKNAENISLKVAYTYKLLMLILTPVIIFIEGIIKIFTGKGSINNVTNEEISSFIDLGKDSGTLETKQYKRLKNTLDLDNTLVEEIMLPRVQVETLSSDVTLAEALTYYKTHTHTRIPVYTETIDKVIGIINIRLLLKEIDAHGDKKTLWEITYPDFLKVPINQPIDNLLETFQKEHRHMAIVIDEYGWVAGIITLEDIIEEIVWEIRDESDKEKEWIKSNDNGWYIVDSTILMEDMLERFELEFKDIGVDEKEFGGETVSYVITHVLERFPEEWEIIEYEVNFDHKDTNNKLLSLKILSIDDTRIVDVEVKLEDDVDK